MGKGDKHHYIPIFYLKQWAGPDGRVCEFSKPFKTVKPKRVHPDGTGYERGLYSFPNLPSAVRDAIEKQLLQRADDLASITLRKLIAEDMNFNQLTRSAWSRFPISLIQRNPESIARIREKVTSSFPTHMESIREKFESIKHPDDPRTFEEVMLQDSTVDIERINIQLLIRVIDNEAVGNEINQMVWGTIRFHNLRYPLLTSDRPTIMTNGIKYDHSHIVLPITPDRIFFAARSDKVARDIDRICKQIGSAEMLNDLIVRQARKYVYGTDDRQLRFVANRFGQAIKSTPFE